MDPESQGTTPEEKTKVSRHTDDKPVREAPECTVGTRSRRDPSYLLRMNQDQPQRAQRLRFEEFDHQTSQNGRARVRVVFVWDERRYTGEATGVETREGSGRTAALAAIAAASSATQGRFAADLVGIKLVRAFDAWIVITALKG